MTLRRARLCDDAEKTRAGFDLHEKSHLSTVAASDWHRRGLFPLGMQKAFSSEPALPFKIPVASLSRFVTFPFGYLKTRVIGKRSDWSRWRSSRENQ